MTLEEALSTALEYENKVHSTYRDAAGRSQDQIGRRVFKVLADEEQGHIRYLETRLSEWQKTGKITLEQLKSVIPPQDRIQHAAAKLDRTMARKDFGSELEMLRKALALETETNEFYVRMVHELKADGQKLFKRFVEIEEGHKAIVQAEIDHLTGSGYWFDFPEFDMEAPI